METTTNNISSSLANKNLQIESNKKEIALKNFIEENFQSNQNNRYSKEINLDDSIGKILIQIDAGYWTEDLFSSFTPENTRIVKELSNDIYYHFYDMLKQLNNGKNDKITNKKLTDVSKNLAKSLLHKFIFENVIDEYDKDDVIHVKYYWYEVSMQDIFSKVLDEKTFELFENLLNAIKYEKEPSLIADELSNRNRELKEELNSIEQNKQNIKRQLDYYQEMYENFDEKMSARKKELEKEITKINKQVKKIR